MFPDDIFCFLIIFSFPPLTESKQLGFLITACTFCTKYSQNKIEFPRSHSLLSVSETLRTVPVRVVRGRPVVLCINLTAFKWMTSMTFAKTSTNKEVTERIVAAFGNNLLLMVVYILLNCLWLEPLACPHSLDSL